MENVKHELQRYMDQEKMHCMEGRRGLEQLCKLVHALGYKDSQYFGQLSNGTSIGDLMEFFEDNSGAIDAVIEWIGRQKVGDWLEALEDALPDKEEESEDNIEMRLDQEDDLARGK